MKDEMILFSEALELRKKLNEDSNSPIDIFTVVNRIKGLTLVSYPMSDKLSGMCIKDSKFNLIAINSNMSYGRQRFTLAHELYHLYFDRNMFPIICSKDLIASKSDSEKEADDFASYLLAPFPALKEFISEEKLDPENDPSAIVKIEQFFGLSRQATLIRLKRQGYISDNTIEKMKKNIISSALKHGYDNKLYIPTNAEEQYFTKGAYVDIVEQLKENEVISNGKYEEILLDAFRSDIVYNLGAEDELYD